jgi:UDP-2,3-diacylglucosamine hydrolase
MILFLSDLHLGRGSRAASRSAERDAIVLLQHHRASLRQPGARLILLGDVFDAYMEYRTLMPVGAVRLLGKLAEFVDEGVPVTAIAGNRDQWQLGHLAREVGITVEPEEWRGEAFGRQILAAHGDGRIAEEVMQNRLRPLLRSRLAYQLYRNVLPGDWGFRLARRVARGGDGLPEPDLVEGLRTAARHALRQPGTDLVAFGHCHVAECTDFDGGTYLNPGYWFGDRTYGVLDERGPRVCTWPEGTPPAGNAPNSSSD